MYSCARDVGVCSFARDVIVSGYSQSYSNEMSLGLIFMEIKGDLLGLRCHFLTPTNSILFGQSTLKISQINRTSARGIVQPASSACAIFPCNS